MEYTHVSCKSHGNHRLLVEELERSCGVAPSDVMISMVENSDEDWSFGLGRAQFLTGELGGKSGH